MKVKVRVEREWGLIRQAIFWLGFCALLALASFEAGWIARDIQRDDTRERLTRLTDQFRDHDGRITVMEGRRK